MLWIHRRYAILNEVWRLVADGVLNVRDIDSVMSDGLGMRYAFLGALETAHLNAEGMANYCERYNKSIYDVRSLYHFIFISYDNKLNIMYYYVGKHDDGWNPTHDWTSGWRNFETIEWNHSIGQIGRTTCMARRMPHKVEPIEKKYLNALLWRSCSMFYFLYFIKIVMKTLIKMRNGWEELISDKDSNSFPISPECYDL